MEAPSTTGMFENETSKGAVYTAPAPTLAPALVLDTKPNLINTNTPLKNWTSIPINMNITILHKIVTA